MRLRERALQRRGDLFLAVSEALRLPGDRRAAIPPRARSSIITASISPAFQPGRADRTRSCSSAGWSRRRGVETLLRAFAARPAGAARSFARHHRRGSAARAAGAVGGQIGPLPRRPGARTRSPTWMRRATVLAAPSVTARDGDAEGLPNVIVEAAASALPAVGTDHSGIPEAIVEGETGFIVPERDAEALAARLIDDPRRSPRCAGPDGRRGAGAGGAEVRFRRARCGGSRRSTTRSGRADAPDLSPDVGAAGPQGGPRAVGQHRRRAGAARRRGDLADAARAGRSGARRGRAARLFRRSRAISGSSSGASRWAGEALVRTLIVAAPGLPRPGDSRRADLFYSRIPAMLGMGQRAPLPFATEQYRPWPDIWPAIRPLVRRTARHRACLGLILHSAFAADAYRRAGRCRGEDPGRA